MEPSPFRSLVQRVLLPLFSGAQLVPGTASSPAKRPAVVERGRHSIEIKPSQDTTWCLTITRVQPFSKAEPGRVSEKHLARAFVAQLAAMPAGFENGPYATDLMARLPRRLLVETLYPTGAKQESVLAAIDQLEAWSNRSYEGQPIVAAVGFSPESGAGGVPLADAWAEDFGAVLTNGFDTMLLADYDGQVGAYSAMEPPADPPPLAPVRLAAVAHWSAQHPERLALVLNRADELLLLRHGALVFTRRAGSWFFLAPEAIVQQMGGPRDPELRRAVYASCLDVSFAGTGACLGILNADATGRLREIAPKLGDHLLPQESSKARLLQTAIQGRPFQALDRRLRQEMLAIDGATILDHSGHLLAAGAILKVAGGSSGGGRRAAAVALAAYGVGIKVSADGGIEGFRRTTTPDKRETDGSRTSFRLMQ